MAKNNAIDNENILIKVDQNNLVYIDPNSVIDSDGNINSRNIKQEEIVMYVNLEADLVPRSILVSTNDKNTLVSIAKGTINFLKSQGGRDFDTSWTNAFSGTDRPTLNTEGKETGTFFSTENYDNTAQSFGIDSIQVVTKGINAIPTVNINFIDVRGKTLFESPENSPYNAFFHIPWPIFYLTLKGYVGKAIRYRLHLVKFSSKYNDQTGNFEISTSFVGSTYAYMTDIPLKGMLNCPYMYAIDINKDTTANSKDGTNKRVVSKTSKGYSILKSIYSEYKRKGLVPPNFPNKTLRELIVIVMQLDTILEKQILDQVVDKNLFVAIKEYENVLNNYESSVAAWGNEYLSNETVTDNNDIVTTQPTTIYAKAYKLAKGRDKDGDTNITKNESGGLNFLLLKYSDLINKSELFANDVIKTSKDAKTGSLWNFGANKILINKPPTDIKQFYISQPPGKTPGFYVKIEKLLSIIRSIKRTFNQEKEKLQKDIEVRMNTILKQESKFDDKGNIVSGGLGFDPTIRNIFAVLLANAEVYIRLMKDVHTNAIDVGLERSKKIAPYTTETTKGDKPIYPWPEIKKKSEGQKQQVIAYPADDDLIEKLNSNDYNLWPEVEFVENYIEVATNKSDTNAEKETGVNDFNLTFTEDQKEIYISVSSLISKTIPYLDKSPSSFLYEIYERAYYFNLIDSYDNDTVTEQANTEYDNIKNAIEDDIELTQLLITRVNSVSGLTSLLYSYSPFDRYPYFLDNIQTIPYLKDANEISFNIEKYKTNEKPNPSGTYIKLQNNLKNYKPEDYRLKIYPFNSDTYLSYINKKTYDTNVLNVKGQFDIDLSKGFIVSNTKIEDWFQTEYKDNFFDYKLKINDTTTNILNTPYFHKQLLTDFNREYSYGKYVGSAYLLINSLPFKELYDILNINGTSVIMANLFKEVSATHNVPYHLLVKWGSIYHRYKNYILNGKDILDGVLDLNNLTTDINGNLFYNNLETGSTFTAYTITNNSNYDVIYDNNKDVGIHPFYDAVFHQVVNNYDHFDVLSGNTSFSANTANGTIIYYNSTNRGSGLNYWTGLVDNSKFDNTLKYTLLPSVGRNDLYDKSLTKKTLVSGNVTSTINTGVDNFTDSQQNYYRIIWNDDYINDKFSNQKFPSYDTYFKSFDNSLTGSSNNNLFSIHSNYTKVIDLIGTFSPKILDQFEEIFLQFSSEILNDNSVYNKFDGCEYLNFQKLLQDIVTIEKKDNDSNYTIEVFLNLIKERQKTKLKSITQSLLSSNNQVSFTLSNPKEINSNVFNYFTKLNTGNTLSFGGYFPSQSNDENLSYIKLYVGEDIDGYYEDFFISNDIELNEDNIILLRPLILIFAGVCKNQNKILTVEEFANYINQNIFNGFNVRLTQFLSILIGRFGKELNHNNISKSNRIVSGYNNAGLKIETYNFFKSFNDKWIGGNSIGQRLLLEEFLFLDKANKDIGGEFYLNLDRLKDLADVKNEKLNLYSVISLLIAGTGLDMKPLPAYVNYYGTNYSNKSKIIPSKNVAKTLFGTFLEVDYQEASPKIIIQYVGPVSKTPDDMGNKFKYANDTFDMSSTNNNPIIITIPEAFNPENLFKSNKCVAFEVSFGDQAQSIFKGIQLDQASIKNTTESFVVLENIARSESGAGAYNVDIGLFDYYRQASYTCEVTCLGNALIQPTMFFYLKNVPMFRGSYWIYEVNHSIRAGNFTTTFKGTRIPRTSLPDPKDSFVSSYRTLFDRIISNIITKIEQDRAKSTETSVTIDDPKNNFSGTVDLINKLPNEDLPKNIVKSVGITDFGIPYNGYLDYQYILYVDYKGKKYLRTLVVEMGGQNYNLEDGVLMSLASQQGKKVTWGDISSNSKTEYFYASQFVFNITGKGNTQINIPKILSGSTNFLNPKNGKKLSIPKFSSDLSGNVKHLKGQIHIIPKNNQYGIAMSNKLMKDLELNDGDVVYFEII